MKIKDRKRYEASKQAYQARAAESRKTPERFTTVSSEPIRELYTPDDIAHLDHDEDLGFPGEYPYTRGAQTDMYRGRTWTMRQFAGFGTARESNERYKYLLQGGGTGLSVAFDMPTIMGYDSDHERSLGEVGRCGVAIDSLEDMTTLFDGIPLDTISTSMTINGPAAVLWALYIAVGERQGVSSDKLRGTIQNDILKEYHAQKSFIFPPLPSMRIITDILGFAADHVPRWNTISVSGYHIREAGSTAVQELAFTLADGFAYVEAGIAAGLDVDRFAPRLSFFFNAHNDFFEEVAKYRASRRIWARRLKQKYGAKDPRSWRLRFHTQTAGCSLTAQQPENNIVRTAFQGLAAVLGGTNSLHTNSMDEVLALPSERAVTIALRTQQIIASESGVANTIDPLAGSYFVESLTDTMEQQAEKLFQRIDDAGGMLAAIDNGFIRREIESSAYRYQRQLERNEKIVVGMNEYITDQADLPIEILKVDAELEREQAGRTRALKEKRDNDAARAALAQLRQAAEATDNLMPHILDAVRKQCTEGEIIAELKQVFGEYREPAI